MFYPPLRVLYMNECMYLGIFAAAENLTHILLIAIIYMNVTI